MLRTKHIDLTGGGNDLSVFSLREIVFECAFTVLNQVGKKLVLKSALY